MKQAGNQEHWKITLFLIVGLFVLGMVQRTLGANFNEKKPTLESISIEGNRSIPEKDLMETLPLKVGSPYDGEEKKVVRDIVLSLYRSQGFLKCQVKTWDDVAVSSAIFHLAIDEGPVFHFGETKLEGLETLPDKVILNKLTYKPGDLFKKRELFNTQSQLYRTGFFETINMDITTTTANTAIVQIKVKQLPTRWIKAGVGWGSEERERLSLTLTHKNLFRRAYLGELSGTVSDIWQEYKADFINPLFFGTRTEQRMSTAWRKENRDNYSFERILGEASLTRNLNENTKGTWTPYRVKRTRTHTQDPEIAAITPPLSDERSMAIGLNRDTANDLFFPTRGTRTTLILERTGGFFGGNVDTNKISLELRGYRSAIKPVILALTGHIGVIRPFNPTSEVPIFDRFFTGGGNSIRGYRERGVGPKDLSGSPLGGDWALGANAELRFPIFWRFSGAVFIDGGQVGNRFQDVQTRQWKYGAGTGIRFKSPVGPFRLDYGYKLNPDSDDRDHWRLHFSLGESF